MNFEEVIVHVDEYEEGKARHISSELLHLESEGVLTDKVIIGNMNFMN